MVLCLLFFTYCQKYIVVLDYWINQHIGLLGDTNYAKSELPSIMSTSEKDSVHSMFLALMGKAFVECEKGWTYFGYVADYVPVIEGVWEDIINPHKQEMVKYLVIGEPPEVECYFDNYLLGPYYLEIP
eukprot:UN20707